MESKIALSNASSNKQQIRTVSKKTTMTTTVQQQQQKLSSTMRTSSITSSIDETSSSTSQQMTNVKKMATTTAISNDQISNVKKTDMITGSSTAGTVNDDTQIIKKSKKKLTDASGKKKSKKSRKSDMEKENISVKSSFSKFDALQKQNVRTNEHDQQEKGDIDLQKNCRACNKIVYKMEEVKAEKNIWHKNCFRCVQCGKPLNVDTYHSHESVLYCKAHFRQLFAPKAVEDNEPTGRSRKPELIIRENEPAELPPDVVRASDKPDLGLDGLHELNVKERFQVFENYSENTSAENTERTEPVGVRRSTSILSKLAKFQKKGLKTGLDDESLNAIELEESSNDEVEPDDDDDIDNNDEDADLIRAKRAQRERPMSFHNMNDIKSKFERGALMTKEERREERKQEIQNIRSRLFMGKQARIKEMYQQAVADSEQAITSTGKKPEIDIGDKARTLKEKFEKGEMFKEDSSNEQRQLLQDDEMAVFEQGLGKQSRSIFQNLDASLQQQPLLPNQPRSPDSRKQQYFHSDSTEVIRSSDQPDDIKIETSDISSKFRFFETYRPAEKERKQFRITPPREGVVKHDDLSNNKQPDESVVIDPNYVDDKSVAKQTHTATKMLSVFRQMEESLNRPETDGLKPLKRFTPPLDGNRRVYANVDSEEDSDEEEEEEGDGEEEEEDEEDESSEEERPPKCQDEFLRQAQSDARAKQLRAKFETWQANEIKREMDNGSAVNLYEHYDDNEEGQVESAKSLRAKFESLRDSSNSPASRRNIKVNRFL